MSRLARQGFTFENGCDNGRNTRTHHEALVSHLCLEQLFVFDRRKPCSSTAVSHVLPMSRQQVEALPAALTEGKMPHCGMQRAPSKTKISTATSESPQQDPFAWPFDMLKCLLLSKSMGCNLAKSTHHHCLTPFSPERLAGEVFTDR